MFKNPRVKELSLQRVVVFNVAQFSPYSVTRCNHMILPLTFYISHFSSARVRELITPAPWCECQHPAALWCRRQLLRTTGTSLAVGSVLFHKELLVSDKSAVVKSLQWGSCCCPAAFLGAHTDIDGIPLPRLFVGFKDTAWSKHIQLPCMLFIHWAAVRRLLDHFTSCLRHHRAAQTHRTVRWIKTFVLCVTLSPAMCTVYRS